MISPKVVAPVKTGVQGIYELLIILDSGLRRSDKNPHFQAFYKALTIDDLVKSHHLSMKKSFLGPNFRFSPSSSRIWSTMRKVGGGQPGTKLGRCLY